MMKQFYIALLFVAFSVTGFSQTSWEVDSNHSSINFNIKHSGISIVNGKFMDYSGSLTTENEALNNASFNFTIQANSINTNVEARDNHLRSADFFDVETYPTIKFESTKVLATGKPDQYLLYGDLTIKDVTKPVIFDLYYGGIAKNEKGNKIGLKATTTINRFDFNINYDPSATGIGEEVKLIAHLQFAETK